MGRMIQAYDSSIYLIDSSFENIILTFIDYESFINLTSTDGNINQIILQNTTFNNIEWNSPDGSSDFSFSDSAFSI